MASITALFMRTIAMMLLYSKGYGIHRLTPSSRSDSLSLCDKEEFEENSSLYTSMQYPTVFMNNQIKLFKFFRLTFTDVTNETRLKFSV